MILIAQCLSGQHRRIVPGTVKTKHIGGTHVLGPRPTHLRDRYRLEYKICEKKRYDVIMWCFMPVELNKTFQQFFFSQNARACWSNSLVISRFIIN